LTAKKGRKRGKKRDNDKGFKPNEAKERERKMISEQFWFHGVQF